MTTSVNSKEIFQVGNSQITFLVAQGKLSVTIKTERLFMRSIQQGDIANYEKLFGNKEVMEKYLDGKPWDKTRVESRVQMWVKRWEIKDPYSAFAVFKNDKFVGHVVLGHGDNHHEAALAGASLPENWNEGYGTEAANAIVREYVLILLQKGALVDGHSLKIITATARVDNFSTKILQQIGMQRISNEEKKANDQIQRDAYSLDVSQLDQNIIKKIADTTSQEFCSMSKKNKRCVIL